MNIIRLWFGCHRMILLYLLSVSFVSLSFSFFSFLFLFFIFFLFLSLQFLRGYLIPISHHSLQNIINIMILEWVLRVPRKYAHCDLPKVNSKLGFLGLILEKLVEFTSITTLSWLAVSCKINNILKFKKKIKSWRQNNCWIGK